MLVNTIESELEQRAALIAAARLWLKTPFHDNQKLRGAGCDCLGLVVGALIDIDAHVLDRKTGQMVAARDIEIPNYSSQFMCHCNQELYVESMLRYSAEVKTPQPGDVAMFHFGRCYSHAGIVIKWNTEMIHSYVGRGVELVNPSIYAHLKRRWQTARFFDPWRYD